MLALFVFYFQDLAPARGMLEQKTPIILLIGFIVLILTLLYLCKLLKDLIAGSTNPRPKPRPAKTHTALLKKEENGKRWQLLVITEDGQSGGEFTPIIARAGDTIVYNFDDSLVDCTVHFQFPKRDIFVGFPDEIDSWVVKPDTNGSFSLKIGRTKCIDCPTIGYAIYIVSDSDVDTGFVQGGSPPEIILEHA